MEVVSPVFMRMHPYKFAKKMFFVPPSETQVRRGCPHLAKHKCPSPRPCFFCSYAKSVHAHAPTLNR